MHTAIIGAGKIGEAIARKLTKAGHTVLLVNSRGPESLREMTEKLGPLAQAVDLKQVTEAEIIFLSVRWPQLHDLAATLPDLSGKILVDLTNPFLDDLSFADLHGSTASEIVQQLFPSARLVKTLNHYFLKWIDADPNVGEGRRVAFVSGDDAEAKQTISTLLEDIGFHPIDLGVLKTGGQLQQAGFPLAGLNLVSYPA